MVNSDFLADNVVEIEPDEEAHVEAKKEPSLVEILAYVESWLDRDDLRVSLGRFVEAVLTLAAGTKDGAMWAAWVTERWQKEQQLEASAAVRRRLQFGPAVADLWETRIEPLGRLLFEAQGKCWGAAIGDQSRVQETQRANAFAAELLAPAEAVRRYGNDPERLAEDYGISLTSARWRIHNVLGPAT